MSASTAGRTRGRFVPTLTEVVTPVVLEPAQMVNAQGVQATAAEQAPVVPESEAQTLSQPQDAVPEPDPLAPLRMGSALDAAVEALLPQARVHLQAALQTAADALVAQQLDALEQQLRTQLRATVRQAMGLEPRDAP